MTAPLKDLAAGVPAPQWVDAGAGSLSAGQFEETAPALNYEAVYAERWPTVREVENERHRPYRPRRSTFPPREMFPAIVAALAIEATAVSPPGPRSPGVCYVCGARDVPRFTVGERLCECEGCLRS